MLDSRQRGELRLGEPWFLAGRGFPPCLAKKFLAAGAGVWYKDDSGAHAGTAVSHDAKLPVRPIGPAGWIERLFDKCIGIAKRKVHRISKAPRRLVAFVSARCGPGTNVVKLLRVHGGCLGVMRR